MFFFTNFPIIDYTIEPNTKQVTDILTAFFLRRVEGLRTAFFHQYIIKDEDTPESLSYKLYKDPLYYWSLLISNDIINPYTEWVIPSSAIMGYVEKKYQYGIRNKLIDGTYRTLDLSIGINGIHHFIQDDTGDTCDEVDDILYRSLLYTLAWNSVTNITPVTNIEFEQTDNLQKRIILVVAPQNITQFQDKFSKMLKGI